MSKSENPWTILRQEVVYDNKWIGLTVSDVINPSGGKGIYGVVHFKNLAIGALPLDEEMNTWLVGQYRFPLNEYSWEIPEGGGDLHADPVESAKRELLEETGLVAATWTPLLEMHLSNSVTDEHALIYLAQGLEQREPMPEETEQLVVRKLPFEEAYRMVSEGQITDSMSVAAIQKVKLLLLEGRFPGRGKIGHSGDTREIGEKDESAGADEPGNLNVSNEPDEFSEFNKSDKVVERKKDDSMKNKPSVEGGRGGSSL